MHWVKIITNLSPFAVYYQVDSVIRSFFSDRWCAARNFFTSERWCFYYFVFALSANLINLGLGIFCRNQSFPFCAVYRCADFSQYFRTFPCFYKYIFKINGSNLGFFFREIFILRSLWSCFLSIVIAILKTRDFGYLPQILTKLCSLLILLSVILYQLSLSIIVIYSVFWFLYFRYVIYVQFLAVKS